MGVARYGCSHVVDSINSTSCHTDTQFLLIQMSRSRKPPHRSNRSTRSEADSNDEDSTEDSAADELVAPSIELTDEHEKVLKLINTGRNVLISGPAGCGKTTLTKEILRRAKKGTILQTASTGVAVLNLPNGRTLHSALKILVGSYDKARIEAYYLNQWTKLYEEYNAYRLTGRILEENLPNKWFYDINDATQIVVDETSMVSRLMLEIIDIALRVLRDKRNKPMGGLQVIFVGDFLQLPPVYNRKEKNLPPEQGQFIFMSPVWSALNVEVITLTKIFRQENAEFASLLNSIRMNEMKRNEKFQSILERPPPNEDEPCIHICYKRSDVSAINQRCMDKLARDKENERHTYEFPYFVEGKMKEDKDEMVKLVREALNLTYETTKHTFYENMRVMLIRNSIIDKTYLVNGDTGTIVGFSPPREFDISQKPYGSTTFSDSEFPIVRFDRFPTRTFQIIPASWERKELLPKGEVIKRVEVHAVPLIPAWSITAHRAQGSTIADINVHINADMMQITPGAFYVAMSRCRDFKQLFITNFKGYKQSREAIGFYKQLVSFPDPMAYKDERTNLELELIRTSMNKITNPKQSVSGVPVVSVVSDEHKPSIDSDHAMCFFRHDSDAPPVKPIKIEPCVINQPTGASAEVTASETVSEHWASKVEPVLDAFWKQFKSVEDTKKRSSVVLDCVETWIAKRKHHPQMKKGTLDGYFIKKPVQTRFPDPPGPLEDYHIN